MGIKKNFVYSSILTVANYIFPLITYPYVSRVLGVTNIGICNFVDSIIHYFILLSMMGVGAVGIREIARTSTDSDKQSKVFSSLFALNGIATLIMLIILLFSIHMISELREYKELMYVGAVKLVANLFLVEWFFKGTENFKYITNRTIIVKCLYVVSVFLFVRDTDDYTIYFLLLTLMIVVNAAINFPYSCSKVNFSLNRIQLRPFLKPFLVMGCYALMTSMYTSFNVAYLGFVGSPEQVGYYATATKIFSIILAIYTAFTGVMMPRMSALYADGRIDEFKRLIDRSIQLLLSFATPAVVFTIIFAPEIVRIISGEGYEGANLPTRIVIPLILIIGLEQIFIVQVLMPAKQDKVVFRNSIIGAVVGIVCNLLFVYRMQSIGSALTWLLSELIMLLFTLPSVKRLIGSSFPYKQLIKGFLLYIPFGIICSLFISIISINTYFDVAVGTCIMGLYTFLILYFVEKNQKLHQFTTRIFNMKKSKNSSSIL